MGLVLYHAAKSSASRRVRLFLEEKGLDWDGHEVNLALQEQHSEAYLKINPMGVVPTILHDGLALHESGTICEYLDEVFPDPPLMPEGAYDRALVRNWVRHVDGLIGNLIRFNWRHGMATRAARLSEAEFQAMLEKVPSAERKEAWLRTVRDPYTEAELDGARANLLALLDRMEATIDGGWLFGRRYSLADIAVAPFVRRIGEEIAPDALSPSVRPKVADWWAALQARPAYGRADFGPFVEPAGQGRG
ncbi:glutathione S-transferase family protein [Chachezhania sediminis]|uniref:glutathione S-transferase family protein n=1 Tax=Chachezhania sediminis TaxID=2599291 RepID=UPI00131E54EC|nr:glutathione S-transferase family protein [Chachezhania sediminis]